MPNDLIVQLSLLGAVLAATLWTFREFGKASVRRELLEKQSGIAGSDNPERWYRQQVADATRRAERAESIARDLERSLSDLPEIAQRLSATRNLREIPACALELVQEVFDPQYSIFYKCVRGKLVSVATAGQSEFDVGHRLESGRGVVGWTAVKQLPLTPDEVEHESNLVRIKNLSVGMPEAGFSMCLPVIRSNETIGVILVGPSRRSMPRATDLGRTIALMTSVAISSAMVLREQEQLAQTDGLTGLFNKRHIIEHIERAIGSEERSCSHYSIFLFDIDHFKHYNDTHGHQPGDELLKTVSSVLKASLREGEHVGRYGGEEFLLAMADVEKDEALMAAERIRATLSSHAFRHGEQQPLGRISVSGGVATWPHDGSDVRSLIRAADEALYKAKHAGRDRVFAYAPIDLGAEEDLDFVAEPIGEKAGGDDEDKPETPVRAE